jgi:hypothetical protein
MIGLSAASSARESPRAVPRQLAVFSLTLAPDGLTHRFSEVRATRAALAADALAL